VQSPYVKNFRKLTAAAKKTLKSCGETEQDKIYIEKNKIKSIKDKKRRKSKSSDCRNDFGNIKPN